MWREKFVVREGVKAMLTGSISGLGSHYVIELNAVNAQTGDSWAGAGGGRQQGAGAEVAG